MSGPLSLDQDGARQTRNQNSKEQGAESVEEYQCSSDPVVERLHPEEGALELDRVEGRVVPTSKEKELDQERRQDLQLKDIAWSSALELIFCDCSLLLMHWKETSLCEEQGKDTQSYRAPVLWSSNEGSDGKRRKYNETCGDTGSSRELLPCSQSQAAHKD